jgi:hypothetical protein
MYPIKLTEKNKRPLSETRTVCRIHHAQHHPTARLTLRRGGRRRRRRRRRGGFSRSRRRRVGSRGRRRRGRGRLGGSRRRRGRGSGGLGRGGIARRGRSGCCLLPLGCRQCPTLLVSLGLTQLRFAIGLLLSTTSTAASVLDWLVRHLCWFSRTVGTTSLTFH